jgi:hypothetical protein
VHPNLELWLVYSDCADCFGGGGGLCEADHSPVSSAGAIVACTGSLRYSDISTYYFKYVVQ